MIVDYLNFYYILMLFVAGGVTVGMLLFVRKKSQRFNYWFIFGLLLSAFLLHFAKQLFQPYQSEFPYSLRHSTFENICAVSTILFPWFYLSKSKWCKDYMYYMGMISGISAMIIPTEALGRELFTFDVLRFYYGHIIIFLGPLLMVFTRQHQLDYRRIFKAPLMFFIVLGIIIVNEVILIGTGFVQSDMVSFFDPNNRNSSFIFGPTSYFQNASWILTMFVPKVFMTVPVGPNAGAPFYWPILWLVIPAYLYMLFFSFLLAAPFDGHHMVQDLRTCTRRIGRSISLILRRG